MERVILATPINELKVISLTLDVEGQIISIVIGTPTERRHITYSGATAAAMLIALNKADLSVKSLQRRILERLIADGYILGNITGTPD